MTWLELRDRVNHLYTEEQIQHMAALAITAREHEVYHRDEYHNDIRKLLSSCLTGYDYQTYVGVPEDIPHLVDILIGPAEDLPKYLLKTQHKSLQSIGAWRLKGEDISES
jgi:hypothetical protein